MKNIRIQLWVLTITYGTSFMDGFLGLGLSDALYVIMGFVMLADLVWMWVDYNKQ